MNDLLTPEDSKVVTEILTKELDVKVDQLVPEARLIEDLGADSLMLMEISMALEERFSLVIPDERIERVHTVSDVYELLADLQQDRSSPRM